MPSLAERFDTSVPPRSRRLSRASVNGRLLDAILRHRHFLLMAENGVVRSVVAPLRAAQREILERLGELALREADPGISPLLTLERQRLELLERRIEMAIARAELQATAAMRTGMFEVAEKELEIQGALLRRGIPGSIALDVTGFDPTRLNAMLSQPLGGLIWQDRMRRNFGDLMIQMRRDLATSIALGEGIGPAQRRLRKSVDKLGIQRATMIARSEIQRVANSTAIDLYRRNADVIGGMQWTATLDERSCLICGDLDGQEFPIAGPPFPPPVHTGCRCFLTPVTRSFADLGLDRDEFTAATRASMDGQLGGPVTYRDWFASQSSAFQRRVLGPSRFQRFEAGELEITDMVKNLRILRINELPVTL